MFNGFVLKHKPIGFRYTAITKKFITVASTNYYIIAHDADSLVAKGEGFVEKKKIRLTLTVPEEMAEAAEKLKNEVFYNKSYAEIYRELIKIGLKELEKKMEK